MNIATQSTFETPANLTYYNELRSRASRVNIELIKCIGGYDLDHLTKTLELTKDFLKGIPDKESYIFLRISELLHSVLITRMSLNTKFKSPLYDKYIQDQRNIYTTEAYKIVINSYIEAIERSMNFSELEQ